MTVLHQDSPIVTIFADHGPLVSEITDEIRARGAATHTVSVDVGWLESVSCALLILDSAAGVSAARALSDWPVASLRVVVLITEQSSADVEELCRQCSERHDLVLVQSGQAGLADEIADQVVGFRQAS